MLADAIAEVPGQSVEARLLLLDAFLKLRCRPVCTTAGSFTAISSRTTWRSASSAR